MPRVRANRHGLEGTVLPVCVCVRSENSRFHSWSGWSWIARRAHPFWSADGRLLYYTSTGTNPLVRRAVRARHFVSSSGVVEGEPMTVYASSEMLMPAYLGRDGAARAAARRRINRLDPHPHSRAVAVQERKVARYPLSVAHRVDAGRPAVAIQPDSGLADRIVDSALATSNPSCTRRRYLRNVNNFR